MLGNFAIQEILYGVAEDFDGNLLYTLDQLNSASIEVSADPTEVTDKNGNVIRQIYRSKTATFTATSALLSPAIINAASGSAIERGDAKVMPKVIVVGAGKTVDLTANSYVTGTVKIIGLTNNGVNGNGKVESELIAAGNITTDSVSSHKILTVPDYDADDATGAKLYDQYVVTFDRTVKGEVLTNKATDFPDTIKLTLYAAVMDPCDDQPRAAYVQIESFQPDPSMTISLSVDNTEIDYKGQIQTNYCSCEKELYKIYFPDENAVISALCE